MNDDRSQQIRKNNRRTALWLAGLALFFFVVLFVKRLWLN
ncbi:MULTISPECIES: cytochrome oxidase small assembly protein [Massilia]|jgi:hypothetical protein|uniref:Cytochrome oxidase small assembly protein n=1 Tax=Massilia orientalis TaxID=3050128 RepID=A0ACC7M7T0_9BURK|nr:MULTISPECIES: cytochrome oxidase small assembly protein [Telluria group]MDN4041537.1 cytochrome oxidase small assembly protein [Massilia sp. YIM B02787]